MDRTRVIVGIMVGIVILGALHIPAIPADHETEFTLEADISENGDEETGEIFEDDNGEDESDDSPGISAIRRPTVTEGYDHEVVAAEASAGGVLSGDTEVALDIRNNDDEAGEFTVSFEYTVNGDAQVNEYTQSLRPSETVTFADNPDLDQSLTEYNVTMTIEPPTREVTQNDTEMVSEGDETTQMTVETTERVSLWEVLVGGLF